MIAVVGGRLMLLFFGTSTDLHWTHRKDSRKIMNRRPAKPQFLGKLNLL
jgi:hypothetical protein